MLLPINYSPGIKNLLFNTADCKDTHTCIVESLSALVMSRLEASFTQETVDPCNNPKPHTP